jgi:hypothetical protein
VLQQQVTAAFDGWKARRQVPAALQVQIGEPWLQTAAPQIPTLLSVFQHYTGMAHPQPVAIGGGTNCGCSRTPSALARPCRTRCTRGIRNMNSSRKNSCC